MCSLCVGAMMDGRPPTCNFSSLGAKPEASSENTSASPHVAPVGPTGRKLEMAMYGLHYGGLFGRW